MGVRLSYTMTVDLLICNTRNEELIMKNEADIAQLGIARQKFSRAVK